MHGSMTVKIASTAIEPLVKPGWFVKAAGAGDSERAACNIGTGEEIDQVRVTCRAMGVMAVDTRGVFVKNMLAVRKRIVAIQAAGIMALQAQIARETTEVGL